MEDMKKFIIFYHNSQNENYIVGLTLDAMIERAGKLFSIKMPQSC